MQICAILVGLETGEFRGNRGVGGYGKMRVFSGFWGFLGNIWISYVCTSFGNICGNGEKVVFFGGFCRNLLTMMMIELKCVELLLRCVGGDGS